METQRAFAAIMLSLMILLGYQYFFMPSQPQDVSKPIAQEQVDPSHSEVSLDNPSPAQPSAATIDTASAVTLSSEVATSLPAKDINIETSKYSAIITENGGGIKSFILKDFKETNKPNSGLKQLIFTDKPAELPLLFSWGNGIAPTLPAYQTDQESIQTAPGESTHLSMQASPLPGLTIERTLSFSDDTYTIEADFTVNNNTGQALQGAPFLKTTNLPFTPDASSKSRYLFNGPALFSDDTLQEIKVSKLQEEGPRTVSGHLNWAGYEDTYFLCAILPEDPSNSVTFSLSDPDKVSSTLNGPQVIIPAGGSKTFNYSIYLGPKKLSVLQQVGKNLDRVINFGWFDMLAKPTLFLLNFLYKYIGNYGIAIIMVTILFKLLLWPITHKGMKSMKTMQKIQPKMAKLRDKYKDDKDRLNQEMITLYKTYKINPLGGCLPMVLQIPVFFALYKVLLQTIELRHAPFMLWITDLAAPDRLMIGFDIPYLRGIPVLTVLMGASMFLQQKMTPSAADPTQAKIMMFLPVIFTFMFLNFASGLVLYWFINNLLSIGQQYFINKSVEN